MVSANSNDASGDGSGDSVSLPASSNLGISRPKERPFSRVRFCSRRFSAALVDASLLAFFSAVLVTIQLVVVSKAMGPVDPFFLVGCVGFASVLAFIHQLTYGGPLLYCAAAYWASQHINESYRGYFLTAWALVILLCLLYQVVYECSYFRATPGKQLFGLQVASTNSSANSGGNRLPFASVLQRCFYKFCTSFALILPAIYLILCNRHQLLHDRLARTCVVNKQASWDNSHALVLQAKTVADSSSAHIVGASLWRRVPAAILDSLLYTALNVLVSCGALLLVAYVMPAPDSPMDAAIVFILAYLVIAPPVSYLVTASLLAYCESSKLSATPGKIVMGLKVTDAYACPLSFKKALEKQFIQSFLYLGLTPVVLLVLVPVYWFSLVPEENNYASFAALLAWPIFYLLYGSAVCATFFANRQTLLDRLCNRRVIVEVKKSGGIIVE
ncbi:RDD family protein [bacterium]|nr:RDD family protein [bacterium]MBP9806972.1 RDD family protein [bacterium]